MQRIELRSRDVPVEIVGGEVEREGIGEQSIEPAGNAFAILFGDADSDVPCLLGDGVLLEILLVVRRAGLLTSS